MNSVRYSIVVFYIALCMTLYGAQNSVASSNGTNSAPKRSVRPDTTCISLPNTPLSITEPYTVEYNAFTDSSCRLVQKMHRWSLQATTTYFNQGKAIFCVKPVEFQKTISSQEIASVACVKLHEDRNALCKEGSYQYYPVYIPAIADIKEYTPEQRIIGYRHYWEHNKIKMLGRPGLETLDDAWLALDLLC